MERKNEAKIQCCRDLAEATSKWHKKGKRDILTMLTTMEIVVSRFAHTYLNAQS